MSDRTIPDRFLAARSTRLYGSCGFVNAKAAMKLTRADVPEEIWSVEEEWDSSCIQKEHFEISSVVDENLLREWRCPYNYAAKSSNAHYRIRLYGDAFSLLWSYNEPHITASCNFAGMR